ncbi:hypothetical protein M3G03_05645 [Aestuariimicrobium sp. p3-SID1156]|uniref:sirohydrochlorin chelatase n=1 Tax=Aestuariimicrobium sp. p3-SID1156 TaxID=2916038 RepID=UPI00223A7A19|nr:CbiX/SirB N-terminal domain-containing protein [Aestuariimicrobium sp. p3-SID1156]MCT1459023.1 hypothetical protein [Aestuariimicrobium sp. p3-SID1156]
MTAPTLVMLARGHREPNVQQLAKSLRQRLLRWRPAISSHFAFVDDVSDITALAEQLLAQGRNEMACVPLDLSRAVEPDETTCATLASLQAAVPDMRVGVSRPLGPSSTLLNVLDERLRTSLRATRTVELDGLVMSLPRSGDVRGNTLVSRRARQWSNHHRLPVVVAVADGSGPNVASAISSLRAQGRRHIAVGSFFIAENEPWVTQAELAVASGATAVGAPIGPDDRLLELVMARYSYAAMELLDMPEVQLGPDEAENLSLDESL